jgi:hypothetical protein
MARIELSGDGSLLGEREGRFLCPFQWRLLLFSVSYGF